MENIKDVLRKIGGKEIDRYATKFVYSFFLLFLYIINLTNDSFIPLIFFIPLFLLSLLFSFFSIEGEKLEEEERKNRGEKI